MVTQIYKIGLEIWVPPSSFLPLPKFDHKHQNLGAISHNFATWSRISPESNKTSSIGKWRCKLRTFPHRQTQFGVLWSTSGENRTGIRMGIATHLVWTWNTHAINKLRVEVLRKRFAQRSTNVLLVTRAQCIADGIRARLWNCTFECWLKRWNW